MINLKSNIQRIKQIFGAIPRNKTVTATHGLQDKSRGSLYISEWEMAKNMEDSNNVDNSNGFIDNTETKGNLSEQFY